MAFDGNRHSIAYSTKLNGCICYSFVSSVALDNGMLIAKGDIEEGEREIYSAKFDITKRAYLVLNPAWQYDDSSYAAKYDEGMYYIEACKPFRGYDLIPTRRYEVSSDICSEELNVGDYVIATAEGKLSKASGADNPGNAFVGKVVFVNARGFKYSTGSAGDVDTGSKFYTIEVVKNSDVAD